MKTILVPLDGSELAARALPYAVALAEATDGSLVLVRSISVTPVFGLDQTTAEAEATAPGAAEDELATAAGPLRAGGRVAEARVVYGAPADGILTAVDEVGADVVVMSTHGRGAIGRLVHGSVADEVLRRSPVPVLIVPAQAAPTDWSAVRDPVFVVALDGSELAELALPTAIGLARGLGVRLALLRVVEPSYSRIGYVESFAPYGLVESDPAEDAALARTYLEGIAAHLAEEGIAAEVVVDHGLPAATLTEVAERLGALGIAMATHGRGGLARVVLGSVATGLLARSKVPLLLVHPPPGAQTAGTEAAPETAGRS